MTSSLLSPTKKLRFRRVACLPDNSLSFSQVQARFTEPRFRKVSMRAYAAALLVAAFLLAARTPSLVAQETPVHIGVLLDDLKLERWQRDSKLLQAHAHERGAKITVKDDEGSDSLQLQQASQLLDSGVNVLIVVPHDAEKAAAIAQAAERKHVPVISYDRLIKNA